MRPVAEQVTECDNADDVIVAPVHQLASVQCDALDKEHDRCAAALAHLAEKRDLASLRAVKDVYVEHFGHEEALLDMHLYAEVVARDAGDAFDVDASTRRSHWHDHERMIRELKLLERDLSEDGRLAPQAVDRVLRDFEAHATRYDGNYADRLGSSLRKTAEAL